MKIGDRDILLPTTMVGNYPNPRWYDGRPWATYPDLHAEDSQVLEAFQDAVLATVVDQEDAGLDLIADGRIYGGDSSYGQILYHYVERLAGYQLYGPGVAASAKVLYAPRCDGPISRRMPLHLENVRALRRATDRPLKVSYTGIQVLALFTDDHHYRDHRDLALALADAFREDFAVLADEGVDVIQIDEFAWAGGVTDWEIEVLNRAVKGIGCQFWVHVCWGQSTRPRPLLQTVEPGGFKRYTMEPHLHDAPDAGRAEPLWPCILDADITALNLEVGGPGDLETLTRHGWPGDFVAGVIDVRSLEIEPAAVVAERIRAVLRVVPADRLGLTTDCGLVHLPRQVAHAKLRALAEGAAIVRRELTSPPSERSAM